LFGFVRTWNTDSVQVVLLDTLLLLFGFVRTWNTDSVHMKFVRVTSKCPNSSHTQVTFCACSWPSCILHFTSLVLMVHQLSPRTEGGIFARSFLQDIPQQEVYMFRDIYYITSFQNRKCNCRYCSSHLICSPHCYWKLWFLLACCSYQVS
jgi:hypothetical protein